SLRTDKRQPGNRSPGRERRKKPPHFLLRRGNDALGAVQRTKDGPRDHTVAGPELREDGFGDDSIGSETIARITRRHRQDAVGVMPKPRSKALPTMLAEGPAPDVGTMKGSPCRSR